MPVEDLLAYLPSIVTLLTVLTSGGDLLSAFIDVRKPIWGDARIQRDFEVLGKIPSWVLFTAHGRQRWQAAWVEHRALRTKRGPDIIHDVPIMRLSGRL
jgi:hypothetical protein